MPTSRALPPEAAVQGGRFSYAQARALGWSSRSLRRAVRAGELRVVTTGVYQATVGFAPMESHHGRVVTIRLRKSDGWALARRSAAVELGLPVLGQPPKHLQWARDRGDSKREGHDRHAVVTHLPADQVFVHRGTLMTVPARVVVDIARGEGFRNGLVVADGALRRGVTREELERVLRTMRRWPGVRTAAAVVAAADGRRESAGETLTWLAMPPELPSLEPQVEVVRQGRVMARVDGLLHEPLLAIEFHGAVKFTGEGVLPDLLARQEVLRSCGIDVLNTDWDEVYGRVPAFQQRVRERVAERVGARLAVGVTLRSTVCRPQKPLLGGAHLVRAA